MKHGVSLRLRLTLLSVALVGVTLLLFSLIVYFTLARTLTSEVDSALVDRAHVVRNSITVSVAPSGRLQAELPDIDAIAAGGAVVQVVDLDNAVIAAKSAALGRASLPVTREALAAARGRHAIFELVQVGGVDLRLYDEPLVIGPTVHGILQVGRPVGPTEAALARLRFILIGGAGASVVICGLIGLVVARAALRPIGELTREAEQIGRSLDFGNRVSPRTAGAADEVGRLAATFNDVLDRLQSAYAALQSANKRLEAALASQRRFVADASHELRTPLTTVRGNASLLRRFDALSPDDRREAVAQIGAEAERMSRLVNDLLMLARADAGQLLERKPVALAALIDDVAHQARVLAEGRVAISVLRLGNADASVLGDADALRQLLLILVDNAIKYTSAGGSVTLGLRVDQARVEQARAGQKNAHIAVVDTGAGIAAQDLPHIFDRFYRADRARRAGGTGLGLAIGKWIAEAHGGTIAVESSLGAGSIFTITLPVYTPPAPTVEPAAPDVRPAAHPADAAPIEAHGRR